MWGQTWDAVFKYTAPYPNKKTADITEEMVRQNLTPQKMFKLGEQFYVSLNMSELPKWVSHCENFHSDAWTLDNWISYSIFEGHSGNEAYWRSQRMAENWFVTHRHGISTMIVMLGKFQMHLNVAKRITLKEKLVWRMTTMCCFEMCRKQLKYHNIFLKLTKFHETSFVAYFSSWMYLNCKIRTNCD